MNVVREDRGPIMSGSGQAFSNSSSFDPGQGNTRANSSQRIFDSVEYNMTGITSVDSLEEFAYLLENPIKIDLTSTLRWAGVPNCDNIESDCFKIAKEIDPDLRGEGISVEDAAVIASYTYDNDCRKKEDVPYSVANKALNERDRDRVKAVLPYTLMLLKAIRKLKRFENKGLLYRGINCSVNYSIGSVTKWWGFSSTSLYMGVVSYFTFNGNGNGTVFFITGGWGYDVRQYSFFGEHEILLDLERTVKTTKIVNCGNYNEVHVEIVPTDIIFKDAVEKFPVYGTDYYPPAPPPGHFGPPPGHHHPPGPPPGHHHPPGPPHGPPTCPHCGFRPSGPPPRPPGPPPPCPGCGRMPPRPPHPPRGPPRGPPPPCPHCGTMPPPPPCPRCGRRPF